MMRGWEHGGSFSLNAEVWVPSWDRAGMERLIRYCARPVFAGERPAWLEPFQRLVYRLPKLRLGGQTALYLRPLAFLDCIAALVPPPRKHRHRYHGVLAPNSPLRPAVTAAYAGPMPGCRSIYRPANPLHQLVHSHPMPQRPKPIRFVRALSWAVLVAFVTEPTPVQRILLPIDKPATPPPISPARSPPVGYAFDRDQPLPRPRSGRTGTGVSVRSNGQLVTSPLNTPRRLGH
jgi:hypothetical protein